MSLILESLQIQTRPGDSTGVGTTIMTIDSTGLKAVSPVKVMQDLNLLHDKMPVPFVLVAATVSSFIWGPVNEGRWQLSGVSIYFQTGSTSGTLQVEVCTGTQAPGAGTVQLTGTMSLAAAAQQIAANGTLIASPTIIGPGDRVGIVIAGTMTSLANGLGMAWLKRVG